MVYIFDGGGIVVSVGGTATAVTRASRSTCTPRKH